MTPPSYAEWLGRGRAHQAEQRPVDAMLCYRRAVHLGPEWPEAHQHLGEVLWQMGKLNEALGEWREARRVAPAAIAAHVAYAEGNLAIGHFDEALAASREAIRRFPGLAPAALIAAAAQLALEPDLAPDATDGIVDELRTALTSDYALLRMPSLAGPLAASFDRLLLADTRAKVVAPVVTVMQRVDLVAQLPALLVALVAEHYVDHEVAASTRDALFVAAAARPYGATEHDALRRVALAAFHLGHAGTPGLVERYATLCVEVFSPSLPPLWPRRTGGARLRVLLLVREGDPLLAPGGWITSFVAANRARCDVAVLSHPGSAAGAVTGGGPSEGEIRRILLPQGVQGADARQVALLDADVLVDALGLTAGTGPLLVARPARRIVGLSDRAAVPSLADALLASPGALEHDLALQSQAIEDCTAVPDAATMASLFNDAVRFHQEGEREQALEAYGRVLDAQPEHAQTLYLRGSLHEAMADPVAALRDFRAALAATPRFIDARVAAVRVATALGFADAAVKLAQEHLAMAPGFLPLWRVLGLALLARRDGERAAEAFTCALRLDVTDGETHYNHGVALQMQRRLGDAARAYQRALAFNADLTAADFNLGVLFQEQGNVAAATAAYRQVLRQDVAHAAAYKNLGEVLFAAGKLDAWRANFREFENHCAGTLPLAVQALEVCQHFADFPRLEHYLDGLRNERFSGRTPEEVVQALEELLYLLLFFDVEQEILHRFAKTYDATARIVYGEPSSEQRARRPGKTRIGYLSADLRNHVMGKMMWAALQHHDRERFEVSYYSMSREDDEWTAQFRGVAHAFVALADLPDRDAAKRIADDDLDVLVDLSTHTRGARPGILALKPARVQVTHVASAGTVGLSAIDFKLTDAYADVPENQEYTIEQLLPMAGCVYPYRRIAPAPEHPYHRDRLGIAPDAFVVGAFVTPMKLSQRCLRLWREVFERVPHARLAISPNDMKLHGSFVRLLTGAGIAEDRLVVVPQGHDEHENQARYAVVDLVLDPMPFGGVNGTLEALDMGVPVVTLCGRKHGERTSYSILMNLGVEDTIATTGREYVDLAVRLATDRDFMAGVRAAIRQRIAHSPLTDMMQHTRNLEAAYLAAMAKASAERRVSTP